MRLGFHDYLTFPQVTPVLRLPLWTAFPPILISLAMLFIAALISLVDALRIARGRAPYVGTGGLQGSD